MMEKKELYVMAELPVTKNGKVQMTKTAKALKEFGYDKPVNKDPLVEMPKPEISFYRVKDRYFFSRAGLETFCEKNDIPMSSTYRVEYYREFACRTDVIKMNGKYYAAVDEDGYGVYNCDRSVYRGEYVWEFEYGSLRAEYQLLKDIGVTLENDVYGKIDERYEYIKQKIKEKNEDFKRKLKENDWR